MHPTVHLVGPLLLVSTAVVGLAGYAAYAVLLQLGAPSWAATGAGLAGVTALVLVMVWAAVVAGGWALVRFDVATVRSRVG